jgi:hypothetical protein
MTFFRDPLGTNASAMFFAESGLRSDILWNVAWGFPNAFRHSAGVLGNSSWSPSGAVTANVLTLDGFLERPRRVERANSPELLKQRCPGEYESWERPLTRHDAERVVIVLW